MILYSDMFILLPSLYYDLSGSKPVCASGYQPSIPELLREFDPGRIPASAVGIPGLSYRDKLVLGSVFDCNPLRTAAANGKRIQTIGHSGAT